MSWGVFLGAFAGSLIELVEILAVVLVVGRVSGWRNALFGAGSAMSLVVLAPLVVGEALTLIPVHLLEFVAGALLLAFGGRGAGRRRGIDGLRGATAGSPAAGAGQTREVRRGGAPPVLWDLLARGWPGVLLAGRCSLHPRARPRVEHPHGRVRGHAAFGIRRTAKESSNRVKE